MDNARVAKRRFTNFGVFVSFKITFIILLNFYILHFKLRSSWHGCPQCMRRRGDLAADKRLTAEETYQRTMDRKKEIEAMGYTVIGVWECEYRRQLRSDPDMKDFIDSIEIMEPMDPREGMTFQNFCMYYVLMT